MLVVANDGKPVSHISAAVDEINPQGLAISQLPSRRESAQVVIISAYRTYIPEQLGLRSLSPRSCRVQESPRTNPEIHFCTKVITTIFQYFSDHNLEYSKLARYQKQEEIETKNSSLYPRMIFSQTASRQHDFSATVLLWATTGIFYSHPKPAILLPL